MVRRVAQHEWRLLRRERAYWLSLALLVGVSLYALLNGATWIGFQQRTLADALREEGERLRAMQAELREIDAGRAQPKRFRDPARPGWVGEFLAPRYAVLPPAPLARLSIGQRDLYPYYFLVSTLSPDTFIQEDEIENPFNLLTGRFDLAFVIIYLFPLFILAFSFNLLAGEKETGTLPLALAQPLRKTQLVAGKALALGTALILPMVGLSLVCGALAGAGLDVRLWSWLLTVTLYGCFWLAAAVLVNVYGRSAALNAVALACLWLTLVVLIPAALSVLVGLRYPVPSRLAFINAVREERRATGARVVELREAFYAAHPELKPVEPDKNDFMPGFYAAQYDRDQRLQPLAAAYEAQLARQHALAQRLRFLSPAIVMQSALNDLAATGFERYSRFQAQVQSYHRAWQDFFLPKMFRRARLTAEDYDRLPQFTFAEEAASEVYRRVAAGWLGLTLMLTLLLWLMGRRLPRYAVIGNG